MTSQPSSYIEQAPGEPLTVWRGESSGTLFDTFDLSKTHARVGFFFAEDFHQAQWYARGGTRARAFHLKASKVLDLREPCRWLKDPEFCKFMEDYTSCFDEWTDRFSGEPIDALTLIEAGALYDYEGTGEATRWNALFRRAQAHGYDAVVANDATDGSAQPVWVVFEPQQIERAAHLEPELAPLMPTRARIR